MLMLFAFAVVGFGTWGPHAPRLQLHAPPDKMRRVIRRDATPDKMRRVIRCGTCRGACKDGPDSLHAPPGTALPVNGLALVELRL